MGVGIDSIGQLYLFSWPYTTIHVHIDTTAQPVSITRLRLSGWSENTMDMTLKKTEV